MATPVFFPGYYSVGSGRLSEALDALSALDAEQVERLTADIAQVCSNIEAADAFARDTGLTQNQVSRIVSLALRLYMASATTGRPMAAAVDELAAAGESSERVAALRSFVSYLAQVAPNVGAYMGNREAVDRGIPKLIDAQISWELRAAFGDAVYREGNTGEAVDELHELLPMGVLTISIFGSERQDVIVQIEPFDIDWLLSVMEHARARLERLTPYIDLAVGEDTNDQ